jgi:hypothetical protein
LLLLNAGFWSGSCSSHLPSTITNRIFELPKEEVEALRRIDDIRGNPNYLLAIESASLPDFGQWYALFHRKGEVVGAAIFQCSRMYSRVPEDLRAIRKAISFFLGKSGIEDWSASTITCGDIYGSGIKGFWFEKEISPQLAWFSIIAAARTIVKKRQEKTDFLIIKDFLNFERPFGKIFRKSRFHVVSTEPVMMLDIHPEWNNLEDYLASLRTKYRTKANAALARSSGLQQRELSVEDCEGAIPDFERLYGEVWQMAAFRPGKLNGRLFFELKSHLGPNCRVFGWFLDGEMLAFQLGIRGENYLDALYVGFSYEHSRQFALLPAMLYRFVEIGIEEKVELVRYGRTAAELKSTIGCYPVPTDSLSRHYNPAANQLLSWAADRFKPGKEHIHRALKNSRHD